MRRAHRAEQQPDTLLRDDRAPSFFQIGKIAVMIAEIHCDVHIDEPTQKRWPEEIGLLREIDTLRDDTNTTDEEILRLLEDFTEYKDQYPHLAPNTLPEPNRRLLLGGVARIFTLGDAIAAETDIDHFVSLRIEEARVTTELLADGATDAVRKQSAFRGSFMPTMEAFSITACLIDSYLDAKRDVQQGKIAITPDKEFYTALRKAALEHSKPIPPVLRHPSIQWEFATMSLTRLRNRIKHGVTPYSSLHNH